MKTTPAVLLVLLLCAGPAAAEDHPLVWPSHTKVADYLSTGLVAGQLGADVIHAWRAPNRKHELGCEAARIGIAIGAAELTKLLVHRTRPDGSDRKSFFSEHTAIAVAASGWRVEISIPIAGSVGYLRQAAGKHYATDVTVGAAVGALASQVCR